MGARELDELLVRNFGEKCRRGGAASAKPDPQLRALIRTYKRTQAMREAQAEATNKEWEFDPWWGEDLQGDDLEQLFAASRKNRAYSTKRPKGYAPWRPQGKTIVTIGQVRDILNEYRAELPLTARQIFYRMVAAYGYQKNERAYERLTNILVRARRARMIPFEDIRDDGASVLEARHFAGEEAFYGYVQELGQRYERDKLARQKVDIRVYCEAAGMMPQIARVSRRYSVPVYSCSGYDSLTAKYDLAEAITAAHTYHGRRTVVLHLGDYDPSGENIFDVIAEDVGEFLRVDTREDPDNVALFSRIALTPQLIEEHNPPPAPPKVTDSRSKKWGGRDTYQLEALPPDALAAVVAREIERYLDRDTLEADRAAEAEDRRRIAKALPAPG